MKNSRSFLLLLVLAFSLNSISYAQVLQQTISTQLIVNTSSDSYNLDIDQDGNNDFRINYFIKPVGTIFSTPDTALNITSLYGDAEVAIKSGSIINGIRHLKSFRKGSNITSGRIWHSGEASFFYKRTCSQQHFLV